MSHTSDSFITGPTAESLHDIAETSNTFERRSDVVTKTATTTSSALATNVPKAPKSWNNTRGFLASVAIGVAIALGLWLGYFAVRVMVRAIKGRRDRRRRMGS